MNSIRLICCLLFTAMNIAGIGQANFEGKIKMDILVEPKVESAKTMQSMMPTSSVLFIKGANVRVETQTGMGTMVILMDTLKNEVTTLMDMMGQKIAMKVNTDEMAKNDKGEHKDEMTNSMKVKETGETKKIAGYTCKKVIITTKSEGKDMTMDLWYTPDIPNMSQDFKEVRGMPLEYSMELPDFKMTYSVSSIEKQKVESSMFEIPADYTLKTMEELMGAPPKN